LDGIARHRTKVTEVLAAFNASANHGILLHILRQLCQPSTRMYSNSLLDYILIYIIAYTTDFLDALFTLLSFLLQTPAGSTMLMSAGIMSTLIQVMDSPITTNATHTKVVYISTEKHSTLTDFFFFFKKKGLDQSSRTARHNHV
jgi:E3 ubiquitin-protein ligase HUWE1